MKKIIFTLITAILATSGLMAQVPYLFKDINPGANDSEPMYFAELNGALYFGANDGVNGAELWKTDGTLAGTQMVKDIATGSGSSAPTNLIKINGTIFFLASGGFTTGRELWKTDGTAGGTVMVKDIATGSNSSYISDMAVVNGILFFSAQTGTNGRELWKSDGTAAGTVLVKDIASGSAGSSPGKIRDVNGVAFFEANDGVNGRALWKSDGTTTGTELVKSFNVALFELTAVNGTLFFAVDAMVKGRELWKSDGTAAGTVLVKDIYPGSSSSYPTSLTNFNGTLYFSAVESSSSGNEMWKSDGTTAGTVKLLELNASGGGIGGDFTVIDSIMYFTGTDGTTGQELWKTDGTAAGTVLVKDIIPGSSSPFIGIVKLFAAVGSQLYFVATDATNGKELWTSDGTAAGTYLLKDINPGTASPEVAYVGGLNGIAFFNADDAVNGNELWSFDPGIVTEIAKEVPINNINAYPNPSNGNLMITLPQSENTFTVTVYSIKGEQVYQQNKNGGEQNIVLNHLSSGLYILKISNGITNSIQKLVIQN